MACVRIFGHKFVRIVDMFVHCVRELGHMRNILLIIGSLLPLASSWVYIASILRGVSKPQRTTKLLLTIITGLSFFSLWAAGDTSGIWLALASFVQVAVIYGLSLVYGMGGRDKLDFVCIVLCAVGIMVWVATGSSLAGLVASIVADLVAVIPALVKTWRLPHTESWLFYALDTLAAGFIMAAGPYDLLALLFPAYILVINAVFVLVIWRAPLLRGLRKALSLSRAKRTNPERYRQTYELDND
jgi:hypothetical protein